MPSQTEIRQQITSTIIDALSSGDLPPWRRSWANDPNAPGLHTSLSTGNPYRGINQLLLQVASIRNDQSFKSKWWGTFNQIKQQGASVRKGQKGSHVVLFKPINRSRIEVDGTEVDDSFLVMRTFTVFNAEQTTGLDEFRVGFAQPQASNNDRFDHADAVIEATEADVRHGGNKAFYSLGNDYIQMPFQHQFETSEAYYETLLHEACHWGEKRVGFDRSRPENTYAIGELIAEIGSCFLMGELGLSTTDNLDEHASYLKSWLKGMEDPKFIFRAAAQASKAADFILSFSRTPEPVEEPVLV